MQEPTTSGSQGQLAITGTSSGDPQAQIFKMDIDCFEELFEWLSLEELLVLRQTSKRFKQLADYYIREYYPGFKFSYGNVMIYNISDLSDFCDLDPENTNLIKQVHFLPDSLDDEKIDHLKGIFSKVELLGMTVCLIEAYFYKSFHQFCTNITNLIVDFCTLCMKERKHMEWLKKKYPKLQYVWFEDDLSEGPLHVPELKKFFKLNPNVQTFSTSFRFLSENQWILGFDVRLDLLKINANRNGRIDQDCNLLRELYQQGFYKRLHVNYKYDYSEDKWNQIQTLPAVEALYLNLGNVTPIVLPSHWKNSLRELGIDEFSSFSDKVNLASNTMNVERVCLSSCDLTDILKFVRHSAKVKEIRVDNILDCENGTIDVRALNKERKQLVGACKQTIYVEEDIVLKTKWAGFPIKYSLIQLKRVEACKWEPQF